MLEVAIEKLRQTDGYFAAKSTVTYYLPLEYSVCILKNSRDEREREGDRFYI